MGFTFNDDEKKNIIEIPFGENDELVFEVEYDQYMFNEANEILSAYGDGFWKEENYAEIYAEMLDSILGDGAFDAIFAGREPDSGEYIEVLAYILQCVKAYEDARKQKYVDMLAMFSAELPEAKEPKQKKMATVKRVPATKKVHKHK